MKIAHIAPRKHLDLAALGDFDFVLAHIALRDEEYRKHYIKQDRVIYLDNGVWETGTPVDAKTMIELAIEMQSDIASRCHVYATDYINDSKRTVTSVAEFCAIAAEYPDFGSKIVATSQGRTLSDWYWCIRRLSEIKGVDVIAIPRHIKQDLHEHEDNIAIRMTKTRLTMCNLLSAESKRFGSREFYATGTGAALCVKSLAQYPWITGIDTTMACLLASMGIRIEGEYETYKPLGKLDFDTELTQEQVEIARYNIYVLNNWAHTEVA